jgi:two-component system sensor histidine kinase VicK
VPCDKTVSLRSRHEGALVVNADRDRVTQVLLNIVDNAVRYTPRGGTVVVSLEANEREIVIGVHDKGPGIAREELERVFEPFYQSSRSEVRRASGAGLGLSLAKQIVEVHEGRIWAESEVGKGTRVYFALPREAGME